MNVNLGDGAESNEDRHESSLTRRRVPRVSSDRYRLLGGGWSVCRLRAVLSPKMTLEAKHNQAIREEIGDRLRFYLARGQPDRPPTRLRKLLARLEKAERNKSEYSRQSDGRRMLVGSALLGLIITSGWAARIRLRPQKLRLRLPASPRLPVL